MEPLLGCQIHTLPEVDSTNRALRDLARRGAPEGTVVMAERQTAGRGRLDRSWESPPGGLYLSVLLRPVPLLPLRLGVAAARAVEEMCGFGPELKWPNDLLADGRKLAGILVEAEEPWAVAGIGVNVQTEELSPEVANTATSLRLLGHRVSPPELARVVLQELEAVYRGPFRIAYYEARCGTLGRRVQVETAGGSVTGVARRLDPDGALVVETADGEARILAGDVVHLR
ncbi:MAG: biotin--[acetyl-CoA-carboxylase] ligase [Halobacteria archaeon]